MGDDYFVNIPEEEVEAQIKYIIGFLKAKREFDETLEEIVNEPTEETSE